MPNNNIKWCVSELMNLKLLCDNWPVDKNILTSFVDILISNAKARTGISEEDIKKHNKEFYDYLENYFKENKNLSVSDNSEEFKKMCLMFKVPAIENNIRSEEKMNLDEKTRENIGLLKLKMENNPDGKMPSHIDCLNLFNKLSTEEKIKFIMEFQNIEIKLTPHEILVFKSC